MRMFKILNLNLIFISTLNLFAAKETIYSISGYNELYDGDFQGTALSSDGQVVLGRASKQIAKKFDAPANILKRFKNKNYVTTAVPGVLWQNNVKIYESEKPFITSFNFLKNKIILTTAPEGRMIVLEKNIKNNNYEIKSRLKIKNTNLILGAVLVDNALYLAADNQILRLDLDDLDNPKIEKILETEDAGLASLKHFQRNKSKLYFGSTDQGIVYELDIREDQKDKPKLRALFKSNLTEVRDIALGENGKLFAAFISAENTKSPFATNRAVQPDASERKRDIQSSEIVQIGSSDVLWQSNTEAVFSLAFDAGKNDLYAFTGPNLAIYKIKPDGIARAALIYRKEKLLNKNKIKDDWVSAQIDLSNQKVYVLSAFNNGLWQFSLNQRVESGSYFSDIIDAQANALYGALSLNGAHTKYADSIFLRQGNTPSPDQTWTGFSRINDKKKRQSRFAQIKVVLKNNKNNLNQINKISGTLLLQNFAPKIIDLKILPEGARLSEKVVRTISSTKSVTLDANAFNDIILQGADWHALEESRSADLLFQKGYRSFYATAQDPDGDELLFRFSLEKFRNGNENKNNIKKLNSWSKNNFVSFDSSSMPDGSYRLISEATDRSQTDKHYSKVFEINNSSPVFEQAEAKRLNIKNKKMIKLDLKISSQSQIRSVECSWQKDLWHKLKPLDGIYDGFSERFELDIAENPWFEKIACRAKNIAQQDAFISLAIQ